MFGGVNMKRKKIKIVSKFRFTTSLSCLLIIVFTMISSVFAIYNRVEGYQEKHREYIEVYIDYGDTIWQLAREFSPLNKDIRKTIYEISQINDLDTYDIYPGQIIKIPKK